jgi:hypothetical protein
VTTTIYLYGSGKRDTEARYLKALDLVGCLALSTAEGSTKDLCVEALLDEGHLHKRHHDLLDVSEVVNGTFIRLSTDNAS